MGFALKKHVHETDALCAECLAHLARVDQPISFFGKLVEKGHDVTGFVFNFFGKEPEPVGYREQDRLGPLTKPIYEEVVEAEHVIEARTPERQPAQIEAREVQQPVPYPQRIVLPAKQPEDWQKFLRTTYFAEKLLSKQSKPPEEIDHKGRYVRNWSGIAERISQKSPERKRAQGPHFTDQLQECLEEQIQRESQPIVIPTAEAVPVAESVPVEEELPEHFDPTAEPTFLLADGKEYLLDSQKEKLPEVIPAAPMPPSQRGEHPWRKLYEKEVEESLPEEAPKKLPARRGASKHNHDGKTLCEECLIQMVSPGNKSWAEIRENILVVARAVGMVAKGVGVAVFGLTMFFASIFPESIKATTPEEAEILRQDAEERKKKKIAQAEADRAQWEAERSSKALGAKAATEEFYADYARRKADTEASRKEWDDARGKFESERNKQDDQEQREEQHFVQKYNQTIQQINMAVAAPWWDTRDDFIKDDRLVTEMNHTARAWERGDVDSDKLRSLQDEVYKSRQEKNRKDAARDLHHNRFLDLSSRARKCFEQAQIAQNRRDFAGRDNLMSQGENLWREAEGAMNQFRAV